MRLQFQPPLPYQPCPHDVLEQKWVSTDLNPNYPVGWPFRRSYDNWITVTNTRYPACDLRFWELTASRCHDCKEDLWNLPSNPR